MEILNCSQNVLKCNKIVHPAQLTCVVVISCVSGAFGGSQAGETILLHFSAFWGQ